jgi:membrane-associated phospholipid phosphatase
VLLARVAMGVHFLSDVLAGALLGLVIGLAVLWIIPLLF